MVNEVVLLIAALAGTFCHWLKEKYKGEVVGNPADYLIAHPWNTLQMAGATVAACAALIATQQLAASTPISAAVMGFGIGYTADSAFNKGPTN